MIVKLFKLHQLHVYQKIIFVFIILIIPVYLINLRMNLMEASFIKDEISKSMKSNVQFYARQLDDQIAFIRNLQLQFNNDPDLQNLSFRAKQLEGYEKIQVVNRVKERLVTIQNSSNYIVNAGVFIKSFDRTISTRIGIENVPNQEHDVIVRQYNDKPDVPLYFENGRIYFIKSDRGVISYIEISVNKLKETLSELVKDYAESGAFLADDRFHNKISVSSNDNNRNGDDTVISNIMNHVLNPAKEQNSDSFPLTLDNNNYRITSTPINSLDLTLYTFVNQNDITGPLRTINMWFVILSLVSVVIVLVFSFSIKWMIHKPLKELIQAFKILETDNLNISVRPTKDTEFGYLFRSFDRMVEKLKKSIQENYESTIALQHSEFKQLQSQINPHFLYNSFFNIYMICKSGDVEQAAILSQKLGSYYQFVTRSGRDEVQFINEYRHALDYCEIQSIRFSNRIHVQTGELPDSCKSLMVPRFIIQPIVENAFEHAFESGLQRGNVSVSVTYDRQTLRVVVQDNGDTLSDSSLEMLQEKLADETQALEKTGLINVSRRIRLKFGDGSGVFVSRSSWGGLKAEIVMHFTGAGA
ncbi:sensor histidine kinase [Cohnella luojiensis]|uniref:HAMP domain-containing protein n=1 Tax=Cohnella luojiensis TaxID=652876 RepID=A0A4Y8LUI4_9BACL|nr:histidine kinase [Cohnella luojiensis]TFE24709.1 HAMP domain-containing protein [Cohnella luojiensis]